MKSITVAGGNLFRIALDEYGSALLWTRLAAANGLTDPWLTGVVTLLIPPPDDAAPRDGILAV